MNAEGRSLRGGPTSATVDSPASPPPPRDRRRRAIPFVVGVLLLVHLAPIWAFDYFPSQDGPAHLHNAGVIQDYDRPDRTAYREYYEVRVWPLPKLLGHFTLAGLMAVVSPRTAEKIFLSLYVLLLPLSILYAVRALRPEPGFAWLLAFPLLYNFPLHMGFYSFSLGVPLSIFAIGYVLARRDRFDLRHAAVLAILLVIVYFAHLLALLMALIAIGIVSVWRVRSAVARARSTNVAWPLFAAVPATILAASHVLRGHFVAWSVAVGGLLAACGVIALAARVADRGPSAPAWVRGALGARAVMPLTAVLPALLLFTLVVFGVPLLGTVDVGPAPTARVTRFLGVDALLSFRSAEGPFAIAFAALLAGVGLYLAIAAVVHRRRAAVPDGPGWILLAFVALYFAAPSRVLGGAYVLPRLDLYVLIAAVLWLGSRRVPAPVAWSAGGAAAAIALAFLGLRAGSYHAIDEQLRAYVATASPAERNSTLLALTYAPYGIPVDGVAPSVRVKPFAHAGGYVAADGGLVLLNNYETTADEFPVQFRAGLDPAAHIGNALRPWDNLVNLLGYSRRTDGTIDYVLVWGIGADPRRNPAAATTLVQLRMAGYERVDDAASNSAGLFRRTRP